MMKDLILEQWDSQEGHSMVQSKGPMFIKQDPGKSKTLTPITKNIRCRYGNNWILYILRKSDFIKAKPLKIIDKA